jgi:hypothetical protein
VYATSSQRWLYLTDEEIEAAVAQIATRESAAELTRGVLADVGLSRDHLADASGRIWWLVRPLAWRMDRFRRGEARVSVWNVTVLSAAGVAAPQSEFVTVTLDLVWIEGGWRLDGVRTDPGPTPMTGPKDQPLDAERFDAALDGFTRIDEEPVE